MATEAAMPGVLAALGADIDLALLHCASVLGESRVRLRRRISIVFTPCVMVAIVYRFAHLLWRRGWRRSARALSALNVFLHHVDIHPASALGPGLYIPHPAGVSIRAHAEGGLVVTSGATLCGEAFTLPSCWPRIGYGVTVAPLACIFGDIDVGASSRIGPRAVLASDLPVKYAVICHST